MKTKAALFAFALCLAALSASAQRSDRDGRWERNTRITQGPSVIEETGTAATLTWTTDRHSANFVRYRVEEGPWQQVHQPGRSIDHALRLTGLRPGRRVEWQILAGDGDIRTSGRFRARDERDERDADDRPHRPNWPNRPNRDGAYGSHVPLYRADQQQTGQYLYTTNTNELRNAERQGWRSVGTVGYVAQLPSWEIPVYRVLRRNGDHFYTTSAEERDAVIHRGGRDEGVMGYICKDPRPGTQALHRMVSTRNGMHFYSADPHEVWEATRHQDYRDEGVMGYIWVQ